MSTASSATLTCAAGAPVAVNDMIVVVVSADNNGSSGALSLSATMTDTLGNTYTNRQRGNYDPGSAAAGVSLGLWTAEVTKPGTPTITSNYSPNTTAKVMLVYIVTASGGFKPVYSNSAVGAGATTGTPTITTASITTPDMVFGAIGVETNAAVTLDGDTTNGSWSTQSTQTANGGTVTSSQRVAAQFKVVSGTATQTYNPTLTSADTIVGWVSITEVTTPVAPPAVIACSATVPAPGVSVAFTTGFVAISATMFAPTIRAIVPVSAPITVTVTVPQSGFAAPNTTTLRVISTIEYIAMVTNDRAYLRPDADTATGSWSTAPLWSKVDEAHPDDGEVIISESVTSGTTTIAKLSIA